MTAVFVMQANLVEGYAMGILVLGLACFLMWKLEWGLPYSVRTGSPPPDN